MAKAPAAKKEAEQALKPQADMKVKSKPLEPNKLRIPIYSMEAYQDFVYIGGGGGFEIKNQIVGYKKDPGAQIMTKIVHEEPTGDGVAYYMSLPKDVSKDYSQI